MTIGGSHHWTYESGQWDETKEEPDLWKVCCLIQFGGWNGAGVIGGGGFEFVVCSKAVMVMYRSNLKRGNTDRGMRPRDLLRQSGRNTIGERVMNSFLCRRFALALAEL